MNPDIKIMITARTARNNVLVLLSISRRGLSSFSDGAKTSLSSEPKMREKNLRNSTTYSIMICYLYILDFFFIKQQIINFYKPGIIE